MENKPLDPDVEAILARLDRSRPDSLLRSIAEEFARLQQAYLGVVARMHALEVTNTFYDQIVSDRKSRTFATMPPAVTVDAAFSLSADTGFYEIEYDPQGVPYRWTGPEPTFFFEILVNRQVPANLRMHYIQIHSKDVDHSVQCYVDGEPIETTIAKVAGGFEVQGVLPPRDVVGGTVVTFVSPSVSSPLIGEEIADKRRIGLAFRWLRIDTDSTDSSDQEDASDLSVESGTKPKKPRSGTWPRHVAAVVDKS